MRHERFERGLPPRQNTLLSNNSNQTARNMNIYTNVDDNVIAGASNNRTSLKNKKSEEKPLIDFGDDLNVEKLSKLSKQLKIPFFF